MGLLREGPLFSFVYISEWLKMLQYAAVLLRLEKILRSIKLYIFGVENLVFIAEAVNIFLETCV